MDNDTETITGEVVEYIGVVGEDQAVQITAVNLRSQSATNLHTKDGEYKLVRVNDGD